MQGQDDLCELQQLWRASDGVAISARGASGGICTLWNTMIIS
jgi:hypothetical protein